MFISSSLVVRQTAMLTRSHIQRLSTKPPQIKISGLVFDSTALLSAASSDAPSSRWNASAGSAPTKSNIDVSSMSTQALESSIRQRMSAGMSGTPQAGKNTEAETPSSTHTKPAVKKEEGKVGLLKPSPTSVGVAGLKTDLKSKYAAMLQSKRANAMMGGTSGGAKENVTKGISMKSAAGILSYLHARNLPTAVFFRPNNETNPTDSVDEAELKTKFANLNKQVNAPITHCVPMSVTRALLQSEAEKSTVSKAFDTCSKGMNVSDGQDKLLVVATNVETIKAAQAAGLFNVYVNQPNASDAVNRTCAYNAQFTVKCLDDVVGVVEDLNGISLRQSTLV